MNLPSPGQPTKLLLGWILAFSLFSAPPATWAQGHSGRGGLQVGDVVEFDHMGETQQSPILSFNSAGWPVVEVESTLGGIRKRPMPTDWVTLVESADSDKPKAKMRDWKSANGSSTVKAKLLSHKDGRVELEKENGLVVTVPAAKLSTADNDYLKELEKAKAAHKDDPFAGGRKKRTRDNDVFGGVDLGKLGLDAADFDHMKHDVTRSSKRVVKLTEPKFQKEFVLGGSGGKAKPNPATRIPNSKFVINVPGGADGRYRDHNRITKPCLSPDRNRMATTVTNAFQDASDIVVIDLEGGEAGPPIKIPIKGAEIFAISDDGSTAVTMQDSKGSTPGILDFWKLSGATAKNSTSWRIAGFGDSTGFAPHAGRFISESRLLTFGKRIALWDCESARSIYAFAVPSGSHPAISPGGNQLAVAATGSIYIVDVEDGNVLGTIELQKNESIQRLAYSENGKRLAGLNQSSGVISIWDLESGTMQQQFAALGGSAKSIQWCGDQHVLVDNSQLMDVALRATVWKYESGGSVFSAQDGRTWFVGSSKLTPIRLPHKDLSDQVASYDPDELQVLKPGDSVSIRLNLSFPASEKDAIRVSLTEALSDIEIDVKEAAPVQLVASVNLEETEKAELSSMFDPFGLHGGTDLLTYTPKTITLELKKDGKRFWSKSKTYSPSRRIRRNDDESYQQAANRMCEPDETFFDGIRFPKHFSQLPAEDSIGTSKINEQGVH